MVIEESDFKITSIDDSSKLFDLELLYVVNKGKQNERTEFRNVAYGISLERALEKIIMNRLNRKLNVTDLKTFLKEYKSEVSVLKNLCNI
jgi:hypothetical protein